MVECAPKDDAGFLYRETMDSQVDELVYARHTSMRSRSITIVTWAGP